MTNGKRRLGVAAVVLLAVVVLLTTGVRVYAQSDRSASGNGLEGTWRVQVTLVNCTTGAALSPAFESLITHASGGTSTGATSNPAFQPGQRSNEFGIWKYTGAQNYSSVREAYILFSAGSFVRSKQRITEVIEVNGDDLTSAAAVQFLDDAGNVVRTGCSRAVGQRLN